MGNQNRRSFLQLGAGAVAGLSTLGHLRASVAAGKKPKALSLGMASYTFRKFPLDEALAMTRQLGLEKIAFKSMHMPLDSTPEQIGQVVEKTRAAGLQAYGCGVVYMNTEAEVQQAFDYAKAAGMKIIIGVPKPELLDATEAKIKQYDIRIAIHNHGPGDKLYPTPESVYEKVKSRDPRMGLCIDIGHTQRSGVDPTKAVKEYADRLFDIHVKDVSGSNQEGKTVEIGRGVVNIPSLLAALVGIKYDGVVALEYEKDEDNPLPGAGQSIGYLEGVLSAL
ncbi:MAG: sugar phosphate isomerase/epimerase [Acidobacteria bacterium]|nr:MAG: sugar phosphate isomerase/epimerase [Acidobacteriota bacterium]